MKVNETVRQKVIKASRILYFPSELRNTTLKKEVIMSILNRQLKLCDFIQSKFYSGECSERNDQHAYSIAMCWIGVRYFLEGNCNWDMCMGVNNPYLMGDAFVMEEILK